MLSYLVKPTYSQRLSYSLSSSRRLQNSGQFSPAGISEKTAEAVKFFELWLPVVIWAIFIFTLSGIPYLKTGLKYDFALRKSVHVTEYFILTFLLYRALKNSFNSNLFCLFIFPFCLSFFYAGSDEIHQLFVLGRSGCLRDVFIDTAGIFGFYLVLLYARLFD